MSELKLMKGNEALAEAAIRAGADAYFGYPLRLNQRLLNTLWQKNHTKELVWWFCRPKARLLQ